MSPSTASAGASPRAPRRRSLDSLLVGLTVLLLGLTFIQSLVMIEPVAAWQVDPRREPAGAVDTSLSPAGLAWVETLSMAAAGAALVAHLAAGGRLSPLPIALALVGVASCFYHMPADAADLSRGGMWAAAAMVAVAIYHLAQRPPLRRLIAASLIALALPLTLRALVYVFAEHAETLRMIEREKAALFRDRGWEPDSPQATLYLRRAEDWSALGWYGLSNVFGSIMAALAMLALAAASGLAARRRWLAAGWPLAVGAAALLAAALTQSKGVAGGVVWGFVLLATAWAAQRRPRLRRWLAPASLAAAALVVAAVVARGSAGPPSSPQGERSLLFRAQYWEAAARMVRADPAVFLLRGAGSEGFRRAYLWAKSPLNPEDITSTHNVFIDWIAMLGVGGVAWSVLLLAWVWQAGRAATRPFPASTPEPPPGIRDDGLTLVELAPAAGIAALAFGTQYVLHWPMLTPMTSLLTAAGIIGFVATILAAERWPREVDGGLRIGLFVAAGVLLVHNQIELTFFHQGASALAWLIVAAAGAPVADRPSGEEPMVASLGRRRLVAGTALLIPAVLMAAVFLPTAVGQDYAIRDAAASLRRKGGPDLDAAEAALQHALRRVPGDAGARRWLATLRVEQAQTKLAHGDRAEASAALSRAADGLQGTDDDAQVTRTRAQVQELSAAILGEPYRPEAAAEAWRKVLVANPFSLQDHLAFADLCWRTGRQEEARHLYRRAERLSTEAYLDPARQLTPTQRQLVNARLAPAASQP